MTDERTKDDGQQAGAGTDAAPVAEAEVVDGEVVEEADVVDAEEAAGEESSEAAEPDPLAEAQRERDEYLELARRSRADFENYKRRTTTQVAEAERRGRTDLAQRLLPALDNLERALSAAGVEPDPEASPDPGGEQPSEEVSARDALAAGVALVYRELRSGLERAGVIAYDPVGERFDPMLHEAISTGVAEGTDPGTVLETLERGYRIDEHVIRPARVVVSG